MVRETAEHKAPVAPVNGNKINDQCFINDLQRLKDLRTFLIQEAICIGPEPAGAATLSFGKLDGLQFDLNGRPPTAEEWTQVENHSQALFRALNEPVRRRFMLGEIPSFATKLPLYLAFVALFALIGAAILPEALEHLYNVPSHATALPFYMIWLMSLGAIGSVAFIGMNALSVQQDITFDLTNHRLMFLRIALGSLFGLVLTLPFGFAEFTHFLEDITQRGKPIAMGSPSQAVLLLLPFLLGFSTSLVILILNRMVDGVQSFFGKIGTGERGTGSSQPTGPSGRPGPAGTRKLKPV